MDTFCVPLFYPLATTEVPALIKKLVDVEYEC